MGGYHAFDRRVEIFYDFMSIVHSSHELDGNRAPLLQLIKPENEVNLVYDSPYTAKLADNDKKNGGLTYDQRLMIL